MIEVGEWIRTRAGHIHKITNIYPHYENEKLVYEEQIVELAGKHSGWKVYQLESIIVKHSKNIIDLIKVKDIIEVLDNATGENYITYIFDESMIEAVKEDIKDNHIKLLGVLTHEQFNSIAYRLE